MHKKSSNIDRPRIRDGAANTQLAPPLLVDRAETRRLLGGVSASIVIRLEKLGLLEPVKPGGTENCKTFYRYGNVVAAAEGGGDE
jgi:hypothetical protein